MKQIQINKGAGAMAYKLAEQHGDSIAVPQLVMAHLARTDGDTVRVALEILRSGETDPKALAKALGLKSVEAAKRALQYWAGAGLLAKERALPQPEPSPAPAPEEIDLSTLKDPNVAVICSEAEAHLGQALGRSGLQRLVGYYLNDGWPPDVLLLCCAEMAGQGQHTVAAVGRELERWQQAGVETGEDAEKYLAQKRAREQWWAQAAALFGINAADLTRWERSALTKWQEEWHFDVDMVEEALLHAEASRTIRYVNGILRSWYAQGLTTVEAVRGKGQLTGSNILATRRPARPRAVAAGHGVGPAMPATGAAAPQRSWNAILDEELEGMNDAYKG